MISNIRYAELGKIAFEYNGITVWITEPIDVMLVDADPLAAARWIEQRYGLFLVALPAS